jgi:hypothetical protein
MKQRCYNPNHAGYRWYGARGVVVCNEWLEYEPFEKWSLENGYADDLSIDRIDSNGNYEPSNCQWILLEENRIKGLAKARKNKQENICYTDYNAMFYSRLAGIDNSLKAIEKLLRCIVNNMCDVPNETLNVTSNSEKSVRKKLTKEQRQQLFKKLENLVNMRNTTLYKVAGDLGFARSLFSDWKSGKSMPKADKLLEISKYFGVDIDYFII